MQYRPVGIWGQGSWIDSHSNLADTLLNPISIGYRFLHISTLPKVINPKYSKHWLYSNVPNKPACTFISGKVCLQTLIELKRQFLPEINMHARLFGTLEYTVSHTIDGMCSRILNYGLFLSLFKLIPCPILSGANQTSRTK